MKKLGLDERSGTFKRCSRVRVWQKEIISGEESNEPEPRYENSISVLIFLHPAPAASRWATRFAAGTRACSEHLMSTLSPRGSLEGTRTSKNHDVARRQGPKLNDVGRLAEQLARAELGTGAEVSSI